MSPGDVQTWAGLRYQIVNVLAFQRWCHSVLCDGDALWQRLINLF